MKDTTASFDTRREGRGELKREREIGFPELESIGATGKCKLRVGGECFIVVLGCEKFSTELSSCGIPICFGPSSVSAWRGRSAATH